MVTCLAADYNAHPAILRFACRFGVRNATVDVLCSQYKPIWS